MRFHLTLLLSGMLLLPPWGFQESLHGTEKKPPFDEVFQKLDAEVRATLKDDRVQGLKELERVANLLAKDYPKEFMPYAMLSAFARMTPDQEKGLKIFNRLAALDDADPKIARIVSQAKTELKKRQALGQPFELKFTALGGKEVNLSQMKGKVVLIDFWATWCGPCIAVLPDLKKTYKELHPKGFEVIGISLDSDRAKLETFIRQNDMPWPQFFDGKGWGNSLAKKHGVNSIPAMWLVDKKGNLVDQNAKAGLAEKVKKYLDL